MTWRVWFTGLMDHTWPIDKSYWDISCPRVVKGEGVGKNLTISGIGSYSLLNLFSFCLRWDETQALLQALGTSRHEDIKIQAAPPTVMFIQISGSKFLLKEWKKQMLHQLKSVWKKWSSICWMRPEN